MLFFNSSIHEPLLIHLFQISQCIATAIDYLHRFPLQIKHPIQESAIRRNHKPGPADHVAAQALPRPYLKPLLFLVIVGIGKTTIDKLEDFAAEKKLSLFEAIEQAIEQRHFNAGTVSKLRHFMQLLQDLFAQVHVLNLCDLYAVVM